MSKKTSRDQENVVKKFPHNLKKQNFKTIKPILFLLYTLSLRMPLLSGLKTIFFEHNPTFCTSCLLPYYILQEYQISREAQKSNNCNI